MNAILPLIKETCETISNNSATALRAQRVYRRHARLIEPEVLSAEQAEFCDLNLIVGNVVEEAMPLCRALDINIVLQQDPRLPAVPMLVRQMEDALSAALDLCLDGTKCSVLVKTRVVKNRAVTTVERWCRSHSGTSTTASNPFSSHTWEDMGPMGQVELIIGDRTLRALGGKLRIQKRDDDLRFWIEIPTGLSWEQARHVSFIEDMPVIETNKGLTFPGFLNDRLML